MIYIYPFFAILTKLADFYMIRKLPQTQDDRKLLADKKGPYNADANTEPEK